jgi:tripartite ATP-independent transporter DctM subunit
MSEAGIILVLLFLGCLVLGIPVAAAIGIASVCVILFQDLPVVMLAHQMVNGAQSYTLIAIPGFMLVGTLMAKAGLVDRLVDFCMALIGWARGGLSLVTMFACMIFAGISGSGTADAAAIGSVMIPALKRAKYDADHAAALVAAGGSIGIIIPPSIPMIIYGLSTSTSIPELFLAGYVPGVLLTLLFMVHLYFVAKRKGYGVVQAFSGHGLFTAFRRAFLSLLAPIIIVGSIILGIVTPTESGIIGVLYILFLGFVVHRELKLADLAPAILEASVLTGVVMFMLMTSALFGWILARENVPDTLVQAILSVTDNKFLILLALNVLLLILGCLMDTVAILVILTPVLLPVAQALGMDPVQFGVMFVFNLAIGLLTPPVGYCLFVSSAIARVPIELVTRRILPFVIIAVAVLALVTYVEPVAMFPRYVFGSF